MLRIWNIVICQKVAVGWKGEKKQNINAMLWRNNAHYMHRLSSTSYILVGWNKELHITGFFTPFWGDKNHAAWRQKAVDSVRILGAHSVYSSCLSWWGLDEPSEVNILLSLSECHKCHFKLLNVTKTVGMTANTAELCDVYITAVNILHLCYSSQTKTKISGTKNQTNINVRNSKHDWLVCPCWVTSSNHVTLYKLFCSVFLEWISGVNIEFSSPKLSTNNVSMEMLFHSCK